MQLYRPISICMHAWVVLESHVINFGAGNEVYQSDGLLCGFQVRADTVHPASAFFFFLAINSSGWDHSLQPFPLVGRFLSHNSPGSPNHFFVLFIDKTWRKARPNLLLSLPRDLIKHTKSDISAGLPINGHCHLEILITLTPQQRKIHLTLPC